MEREKIVNPFGEIFEYDDGDWRYVGRVKDGDPYVEAADANPERRNNGCQIYRSAQ